MVTERLTCANLSESADGFFVAPPSGLSEDTAVIFVRMTRSPLAWTFWRWTKSEVSALT
jgi:hypothetical protein